MLPWGRLRWNCRWSRRPSSSSFGPVRFAVVLVLLAACAACEKSRQRGPDDDGELAGAVPSQAAMPKVVLTTADGKEVTVTVEVVRTEQEVERGLMFRRELAADAGMLFLMGQLRDHTFWMRNTIIPLDMIFIDQDGVVAGVVENTEPRTDTPRSVGKPSLYVLEVNAGWAKSHGVSAGAMSRFEGVPVKPR